MANTPSQKVSKRLTAAQRVKAALEAQQAAMVAGVDAAMRAYSDREAARAAEERADDELRAAVDALVQTGQTLDAIAALTDVPIADVRAARRPKRGEEDGDGEPGDQVPAASSGGAGRRGRRELAVEPADPEPVPPAFIAGGGEEHQGEGEGEQPPVAEHAA